MAKSSRLCGMVKQLASASTNSRTPTVQKGSQKPPSLKSSEPIMGPISMPKPVKDQRIPFILASLCSGKTIMTIFEARLRTKISEQKKILDLHELLRQPNPKPSRKRHKKEQTAQASGAEIKSNRPKMIIDTPSQMQPVIRTRFGPCEFRSLAKRGENTAIEIEQAAKTMPWTEVGTPFLTASMGQKGAIDEQAELANRLTRHRHARIILLLIGSCS